MVTAGQVLVPQQESELPHGRVIWTLPNAEGKKGAWIFFLNNEEGGFPIWFPSDVIEREISSGLVLPTLWTPPTCLMPESALSARHLMARDLGWRIVQALQRKSQDLSELRHKNIRGKLITDVANAEKVGRSLVYRSIYRYWRNGMTKEALVPTFGLANIGYQPQDHHKRRGPKQPGTPDLLVLQKDLVERIESQIRLHAQADRTKRNLYSLVLAGIGKKCTSPSGRVRVEQLPEHLAPSHRQIQLIYDRLNRDLSLDRSRQGATEFDLAHSTALSNAHDQLLGPGWEYQIDDTGCQVQVVTIQGDPCGVAFAILVVDTWSNLVTGFHADLGTATAEAYALAMHCAASPKKALCAAYGVEIEEADWPAVGLAKSFLGDGCSAYNSDHLTSLTASLPTVLKNARNRLGSDKGDVERTHQSAKTQLMQELPSYRRKFQQRGLGDPKKEADFTVFGLRQAIIEWILAFNSRPLDRESVPAIAQVNKVEPTPLSLWRWGTSNLTGSLIEIPQDELWTRLLPLEAAKLTPKGLKYRGRYYSAPELIESRAFEAAKEKPKSVQIRVNRLRPDEVRMCNDSGNFITCRRIEDSAEFRESTFSDEDFLAAAHKAMAKPAKRKYLSTEVDRLANLDAIKRREAKRSKAYGSSVAKEAVSERRAEEQDRIRQSDTTLAESGYSRPIPAEQTPKQKPTRETDADTDILSLVSQRVQK